MSNIISWESVMKATLSMPGVKIDRDAFLISTFRPYGIDAECLIEGRPSDFISEEALEKVAKGIVKHHSIKATAISTVAGIPGGFAMLGTIPGDMAQYFWHYLVMAQKLAYVYGWPDLRNQENNISEEAQGVITLFVGIGFGVEGAQEAIRVISKQVAAHWSRKLAKMALTKTLWYPVTKKVAAWLDVKLTRNQVGKFAGKVIPVIGGLLSGSLTYFTFKPMATKLQKALAHTQITTAGLK